MKRLSWLALASLSACFVTIPPGATCETSAQCPTGQQCVARECVIADGGSAGGGTAGGSAAGGGTAGGSTAGGSTAGGSTAGGSTAGGSTAGGSTAGGSTAGGATAGGSTAGGSTAGGSTAGGSTAGGSTAGGDAGGAGGGIAGGAGGGATDTEAPVVVQATPVTGSPNVSVRTTIRIVFSEEMDRSSLSAMFQPAIPFSSEVWATPATSVTLTPASPLQFSTNYTTTVTARDLAGNALLPFNYAFSTEAAADTTAPTIDTIVPANNAVDVPSADGLSLTFSEPMNPSTVTVSLNPPVTFGAPNWASNNTEFSVNPMTPLAPSTQYVLSVVGQDVAGNALSGTTMTRFTTAAPPDTTPPTLSTSLPPGGAMMVSPVTRLVLNFSEPMNPGSVVVTAVPDTDLGVATWSNMNRTVTFAAPGDDWPASTQMTIEVTGLDVAGNALGTTAFSFRVADPPDITAPTVNSTVPGNNQTGVPMNTDIEFNFSEPMDRTATQGAFSSTPPIACSTTWNTAGTLMVCNPSTNLDGGTSYEVRLGTGARDLAGNALAAQHVFRFTTAAAPDTTPPTVTATVPLAGAIGVPRSAGFGKNQYPTPIQVTFSEPMSQSAAQGAFSITSPSGFNGGTFSWSGNTMTYRPPAYFDYGETVTFQILGGTSGVRATDLAGNPLAATVTRSYRVKRRATTSYFGPSSSLDGFLSATAGCGSVSVSPGSTAAAAGDTTSNTIYRGFLTFNISALPTTATITTASLNAYQYICTTGTGPYGGPFGNIEAWHVNYGPSLEAADCSTSNLNSRRYTLSTSPAVGLRTVIVTSAVQDDLANRVARGNRSQFLIRNTTLATDNDSAYDYCSFHTLAGANRPYLSITYEYD